jgi:hypothetical protein
VQHNTNNQPKDSDSRSQDVRKDIHYYPLAKRLASAGLSHLYDQMLTGPFAVISGQRGQNTTDEERAENNARAKALQAKLRDLQYGYADVRGLWREDKDSPSIPEKSYFVPGMSEVDARTLGNEFQQDAVLLGNRGKFRVEHLKEPNHPENGVEIPVAERFRMLNEVDQEATEVGGKQFTLSLPPEEIPVEEQPVIVPAFVFPKMTKRARVTPNKRQAYETDEPYRNGKMYVPLSRFVQPIGGVARAKCVFVQGGRPLAGQFGSSPYGIGRVSDASVYQQYAHDPLVFLPFREVGIDGVKTSSRLAQTSATLDAPQALGDPQALDDQVVQTPKPISLYVSKDGEEPTLQDVPMTATHDDYVREIERLALRSGSALDAARYIMEDPYAAQKEGLSSVWVDKSGRVHVMKPHTHTTSAFSAITSHLPPGYDYSAQTLPKSKTDFRDLTRLSGGIMRGQFYPHGAGCSIDLQNPPSPAQIRSIEDYIATTKNGEIAAEIYDGGDLIAHVTSLAELRRLLHDSEAGKRGRELEVMFQGTRSVRFSENGRSSVGGRIGRG